MREILIKSIKRHLLLLLLLLGIPSLTYWGLFYSAGLPPITYVINSMAGFLTIIFLIWVEFSEKIKNKILSVILGMIMIYVTMFVVFYTFNYITPVKITSLHLAEAGFSFIFGVCVAISFRLMIFKDKEKDWSETMKNIKGGLKDIFRKYGYYFALIFIITGIGFIIGSEIARSEVEINFLSEVYSNLWATMGFGFLTMGITFISVKIAIDSGDRMNTIGDGEIKQSLINIQEIRKEYLYGLDEYFETPVQNGNQPNFQRLQRINIFSTWLQLENLNKMIIYKKYLTTQQTSKLFRYHRTLLDIVLQNSERNIVTNESTIQLLSGITKLYENFEEPDNFHEKFYELLRYYVGEKEQDEEFIQYITRKKREVKARGMYNPFRRFQ